MNSLKLQVLLSKSTKFVLEFCGLDPLGILALVDIATLSCFNHAFLQIPTRAPCPLQNDFFVKFFSVVLIKEKELLRWKLRLQLIVVSSLFSGNPFVDGILGHNLLLSRAFSVGIPSWMGF
jgi:hypothetical protein